MSKPNPPSPKSQKYKRVLKRHPDPDEVLVKATLVPTQTGFGLAVNPAVGASSTFTLKDAF